MMTATTITVWLPDPGWVKTMGGLPEPMTADVWTASEELPDSAGEVEIVVIPFGVPGSRLAVLGKLPKLRLVQLTSAGAERVIAHVPAGVTLCNARGAHDPAVAEWIMAVILAQLRSLPDYAEAQRAGTWAPAPSEPLAGQTALIVGYGSIGEAVERLLVPFAVRVERVARHPRPGVSGPGDLQALLPRADIVILLVPVTPATVGLADARFLGAMHDHALLVNAARGAIVDTGALLAELSSGRLRAALDVTDPEPLPPGHPLWSAPGLLLTPHVAGLSTQTIPRARAIIWDQLARYAAGQPLRNVVGERGY
jgi:phosphoglycerate dehydrogenase-like enzyme